ncbi:sulfurtransferase TusA [Cobetia crustatorum]|uniref:Sulfurtransferase TusA n=1 Tax=Cobetia crustatorum TaxID=553385 RepID=A0A558HE50_9GAMM|nr:sulfurtransferase TusA [Cobetia crustatorum]TVU67337.1 sulfurtransferase TusA [Cobetia crustatorum]
MTDTTLPVPDAELETSGLYCPEPIMMLHNKVRELSSGDLLKVIATDPATTRDVPKFCTFLGHTLERRHETPEQFLYYIRIS